MTKFRNMPVCMVLCVAVIVTLVTVTGCATIMNRGGNQRVLINSMPHGATATIDGVITITTPGEVSLKRSKSHVVRIEKEGYQPSTMMIDNELSGWVFGNILIGGLIGLAIDMGTGGGFKLDPDTINVTLIPIAINLTVGTKS